MNGYRILSFTCLVSLLFLLVPVLKTPVARE